MSMPKQKPGRSKQDYCTPREFLSVLKERLNIQEFAIDLAASKDNAVSSVFFTKETNALIQPWPKSGWCFLNPPFADIEPWVMKACDESQEGAQIAMLVPASVGSDWWTYFVHDFAHVLFLNGRLAFIPDQPKALYPKDCALLLYTPYVYGGYECWDWRP